eukprot:TRINITY_DN6914_c0_g1_i1.p1 TRINITY_DN6914_c0_g1~~TRINITY_DN6914_c0_g1_i1.p1  ORF type:complete len:330 (-),score=43.54 TRINITY_DN6914_c0_g1_i1:40-1029(-)
MSYEFGSLIDAFVNGVGNVSSRDLQLPNDEEEKKPEPDEEPVSKAARRNETGEADIEETAGAGQLPTKSKAILLQPRAKARPGANGDTIQPRAKARPGANGVQKQKEPVITKAAADKETPVVFDSSEDFWMHGPTVLQRWNHNQSDGYVDFKAALIQPANGHTNGSKRKRARPGQELPIAFYFAGLGHEPEEVLAFDWPGVAPEPFILVVPRRKKGAWWFIDDDTTWGWISGSYMPDEVDIHCQWIEELATCDGVDVHRIGLFGFSAGAYAVTEVLARADVTFSGVGMGGVHGHGQCCLDEIPTAIFFQKDKLFTFPGALSFVCPLLVF